MQMLILTLRAWPDWLFVEVADTDSSAPTLPAGDCLGPDWAEDLPEALLPDHGRGLHLVRSLADHLWWAPREEGGKSVLCRFDLAREDRDAGPETNHCRTTDGRPIIRTTEPPSFLFTPAPVIGSTQ